MNKALAEALLHLANTVESPIREGFIGNAKAPASDADAELREEVVAYMVAGNIAPHVAANRTNTPAKLLAEARAWGVI